MKKYLEYILISEFLLFSGGIIFCQLYPTLTLVIFVLTSFLYYYLYKGKGNSTSPNIKILLLLIGWILLVQFVFVGERNNNRDLVYILNPIGAFFTLSTISFYRFRSILLKLLTILSALSIIVQIGYILGIFPTSPLNPFGKLRPYYMCFHFFNVGWGGEISRLSSIYWEPGQFQIIILFTLCMFVDHLRNLTEWIGLLKKFGILILALLMTISTTGYIAFALLIISVFFYSKVKRKKNLFTYLMTGFIGIVIALALWNSDTVQSKLDQRNDVSERTSYAIRMSDNLACLNITLSSPIYGYGIDTKSLKRQLIMNESETSSNGWLYTSVCLGIPYLLVLLICIYRRIKDMNLGIPIILIWAVLVISQCNEYATFFPIMYMYVFKFANHKLIKDETHNYNCNLQ